MSHLIMFHSYCRTKLYGKYTKDNKCITKINFCHYLNSERDKYGEALMN